MIEVDRIDKQIAGEFSIGDSMVEAHVSGITRGLGARNRTQIAPCASMLDFERVGLRASKPSPGAAHGPPGFRCAQAEAGSRRRGAPVPPAVGSAVGTGMDLARDGSCPGSRRLGRPAPGGPLRRLPGSAYLGANAQ